MAFWSSQTLKQNIPADKLVVPYAEDRIVHSAYELGVGSEAFITSSPSDNTHLPLGHKVVIPAGQFGLLISREVVRVPVSAIAFISIRAGIKFRGLINVSGFHVDPGYCGQLTFAVYNAGSQAIVLDQDQRVFLLWFADLDNPDKAPYSNRLAAPNVITADHVSRIQGDVASPAVLKRQIDDLRTELEKRFHASETSRLANRTLLTLLLGAVLTIAVTLLAPYITSRLSNTQPTSPAASVLPNGRDRK